MASSRKSYLKTIWCVRKTRWVRASLLLYCTVNGGMAKIRLRPSLLDFDVC
ncbi:Uncharacterized protein APZ42_006022 [Daphnia magna]|uniref:Uncharacterized protein n=1 Tax=Daphnia magna TaxID=35525 RepID=A0A164G4I2_9CRUS|nr:Uncharacterized protein APZ42_006022 [Daphnia magna]